jgi:cytidylate kinase
VPWDCGARLAERRNPRPRRKSRSSEDHLEHTWAEALYRVDVDDSRLVSVVLDASRFSTDRLVEVLLAAAGVHAALVPA